MRFGQKLIYMGLGGALVAAGMLLSSALTETGHTQNPRNGNFNTLTARQLNITDANGNVVVEIGIGSPDFGGGGYVYVRGENRRVQSSLGVDHMGGYVEVRDDTGAFAKQAVIMHVREMGGRVDVYRANGKPAAFIGSAEYGGASIVYDLSENRAAGIGVNALGKGFVVP